jgi:hypothetical protein
LWGHSVHASSIADDLPQHQRLLGELELGYHSISGEAQELRDILLLFSGAESGILNASNDVIGHLLFVKVHREIEFNLLI